jgi:hypothetical protein
MASWLENYLAGRWRLERIVPQFGEMRGAATFTAAPAGLIYREDGISTIAGASYPFFRSYLYAPGEDGFAVYFEASATRLFQRVVLKPCAGGQGGNAIHVCGEDVYRSRYKLLDTGVLVIRHAVRGPRKAHQILSRLTRTGS